MVALQTVLSPQVLTKVISRQAATSDWLLNLFGMAPGGVNTVNMGHGRNGAYHIYDHIRKVAKGRAPGTAAGRSAPNSMGRVDFSYPRMHDSISLPAEVMHNLGRIDNPAVRDSAGMDMIRRQTGTLAEKSTNWRKAMLTGILRDSLYMIPDGDDYYFVFDSAGASNPVLNVNARMPSGNKSQLDMLGAGDIIDASWLTTTTDIPSHLWAINAAFQQLCGGHLAAVICPWNVWHAVTQNEVIAALHGSASPPFVSLTRDQLDPQLANTMLNVHAARLNSLPQTTWYITDEGFDLGIPGSEAFTKLVPDNHALFIGHDPQRGAFSLYEGSEPIAEYDGGPETVKVGLNSWSVKRSNPTSTDLFVLDNAFVVNHVPASTAFGEVIF